RNPAQRQTPKRTPPSLLQLAAEGAPEGRMRAAVHCCVHAMWWLREALTPALSRKRERGPRTQVATPPPPKVQSRFCPRRGQRVHRPITTEERSCTQW